MDTSWNYFFLEVDNKFVVWYFTKDNLSLELFLQCELELRTKHVYILKTPCKGKELVSCITYGRQGFCRRMPSEVSLPHFSLWRVMLIPAHWARKRHRKPRRVSRDQDVIKSVRFVSDAYRPLWDITLYLRDREVANGRFCPLVPLVI